MPEATATTFYRSYLLNGRIVYLDKLSELSDYVLFLHAGVGRSTHFSSS